MANQKTTVQRTKQAWLVTWEWVGEHAKVEDKVIAIISGRKSQSQIRQIVELFWANSRLKWFEQISYAKNGNNIAYHAEDRPSFEGMVTCGHNPWIEAHRVHNLEAYIDDDGIEHLQGKYWRPTLKNGDIIESKFVAFHLAKKLDGSILSINT